MKSLFIVFGLALLSNCSQSSSSNDPRLVLRVVPSIQSRDAVGGATMDSVEIMSQNENPIKLLNIKINNDPNCIDFIPDMPHHYSSFDHPVSGKWESGVTLRLGQRVSVPTVCNVLLVRVKSDLGTYEWDFRVNGS